MSEAHALEAASGIFGRVLNGVAAKPVCLSWLGRRVVIIASTSLSHASRVLTVRGEAACCAACGPLPSQRICAPVPSTKSRQLRLIKLRDAQARLQGQKQDRVVPAANPGRLVRCREQRFHLGPVDEVHRPAHIALARHGEDALAVKRMLRFIHRHVAIERPDCGKARVSAAGAVAADLFEMGEEVADERGVECPRSAACGGVTPLARKAEQQSEGVAIARNRIRAGLQAGPSGGR